MLTNKSRRNYGYINSAQHLINIIIMIDSTRRYERMLRLLAGGEQLNQNPGRDFIWI